MPLIPVLIAAIIALSGGGAVLADSAKPGDALYPVDQWVERMQERLTFSEKSKAGLFARFSEERAQEMQALLELDPEAFNEKRLEMWEDHKTQALARLAISIEKAELIRDKFESKLAEAENESEAKAFQTVLERIDEIITRRELKVDDIDAGRRHQGPTTGQKEIREMIREFMGDNSEIFREIHEEMAEEFGRFGSQIAPYPLNPEFDDQTSDEWRELQREMAEKRRKLAEEIAEKFKDGDFEVINPEPINPTPVPLDDDSHDDDDSNDNSNDDSIS